MRLLVLTPHFAPDVAPTGELVTRLVEELAARDHAIDVVTSLPWYRSHRVEERYAGRLFRYEDTPWGRITRVHPFPTVDKRNIPSRAAAYAAFSAVTAIFGARGDPVDGVLSLSPPLTLGIAGWVAGRRRRAKTVFNVQDIYPDVAVDLGVLHHRSLIAVASRMEMFCYERSDAVTVPSADMRDNIVGKGIDPAKITVVPNFVDTDWIGPKPHENDYRREFGLEGKTVVMYAGNVGLSQGLDAVVDAAAALTYDPDLVFVINGQGAARPELEQRARGLTNVVFVDMQSPARLPDVLAAADIHLVPLKRGLAKSSIPSKIYSILASGRPVITAADRGSEIATLTERSGAGLSIPPEDPEALAKAVRALVDRRDEAAAMGDAGRKFVEECASPKAVATAYEELFARLIGAER